MKKYISTPHFAVQMAKYCLLAASNVFQNLKLYLISLVLILSLQGCSKDNSDSAVSQSDEIQPIEGLKLPESAYTMQDGRIIVSEIGEFNPTGKDGDGRILELSIDGSVKVIADSGLNDPKGILVEGSTIYVTDNDEVKKVSFTGEVTKWLGPDDFPKKPQFLNDIAIDQNTMIYVSDSGDIENGGGGAIYRVDSNGKISLFVDAANDPRILSPNGLSTFQKGYLAFNDFANGFLFRVRVRDLEVEKLSEGFGGADGLVFSGANLYISDWKNGKLWKIDISKVQEDGSLLDPVLLKDGFEGSADIDVTSDGKYLVVPEMKANRVVFIPLL
jgi:sugar lactone lactonase YvrE